MLYSTVLALCVFGLFVNHAEAAVRLHYRTLCTPDMVPLRDHPRLHH